RYAVGECVGKDQGVVVVVVRLAVGWAAVWVENADPHYGQVDEGVPAPTVQVIGPVSGESCRDDAVLEWRGEYRRDEDVWILRVRFVPRSERGDRARYFRRVGGVEGL